MIFFDLETHLISQGRLCPPIVCGAFCAVSSDPYLSDRGSDPYLSDRDEALAGLELNLELADQIVGHNVAFDFGCVAAARPDLLPDIFRAYREDRVTDTMLRQELIDIAAGCHHGFHGEPPVKISYSLGALSDRILDRTMAKGEDTWRLRYAELDGTPIANWPESARAYPMLDVTTTRDVYYAQGDLVPSEWLIDQHSQARAAWALHLCAAWGVPTDPVAVEALACSLEREKAQICRELLAAGLVSFDKKTGKIKRNVKIVAERVSRAYVGAPPKTDGGKPATDALTCTESGDPVLALYGRLGKIGSLLDKNIPVLRQGLLHTRYGLASSGRSTSRSLAGGGGDNMQNLPRKGGVRECLVPRPGHVFIVVDYGGLELCTLAQTCLDWFGVSALADALNAGQDVHRSLGAEILGCSYEFVTHDARQTAKVANFGFPGRLSPNSLVLFALASYGVRMTVAQAYDLKAAWLRRWPEMVWYFARVEHMVKNGGTIEHIISRRIRGKVGLTDGCNTFFQGLGADIAKAALFDVSEACYARPASPLFGCRPVLFVHDEIVTEAPEASAHEAAEEQSKIMIDAARPYLRGVKIKAEPMLARRYSKSIEAIRDADGRLVPWGT